MRRISRIQTLRKDLQQAREAGTIGFVPTMGAFHEGHLSLMRKATRECHVVVVSLFVNPLQFGPKEDYAIYPRKVSSDRNRVAALGVDFLWTPSDEALFPKNFQTSIEVCELSRRWEGVSRPQHFKGVATIVTKLLYIVQPDRLYLGQKDYQQTRVITQLIQDLHFETKVRICPTIREKDGLAMSSRNARLSLTERSIAPLLYRSLQQAKVLVQSGERETKIILKKVKSALLSEQGICIDYLSICNLVDLKPIARLEPRSILLAAIHIGSVRLIDNIVLKSHLVAE